MPEAPKSNPPSVPVATSAPSALPNAPMAYENDVFLNSPDGRMLRIISEYQEPLSRFRRERIQDTVVFFGSARFIGMDEAHKQLKLLDNTGSTQLAPEEQQPEFDSTDGDGTMNALKHSRAEAAVEMAAYYEDARQLARMMTEWAKKLPGRRHR